MVSSFNLRYFANNEAFVAIIYLRSVHSAFRSISSNWFSRIAIIIVAGKELYKINSIITLYSLFLQLGLNLQVLFGVDFLLLVYQFLVEVLVFYLRIKEVRLG
jgi:hypothetical protein